MMIGSVHSPFGHCEQANIMLISKAQSIKKACIQIIIVDKKYWSKIMEEDDRENIQ